MQLPHIQFSIQLKYIQVHISIMVNQCGSQKDESAHMRLLQLYQHALASVFATIL